MTYRWDFVPVFQQMPMLWNGLGATLLLTLAAVIVGVLVGALLAYARTAHGWSSMAAMLIINFYRNTPPIAHFFWFFYALPILTNVDLSPFGAALLALGLQSGAFYAEVFRGGIAAVARAQWESGRALGMADHDILLRIVLPQAGRLMMAPFVERTFELCKTTALASTLAYGELLYSAMQLNAEIYRPLEIFTTLAVMYLILLTTFSVAARRWERSLALPS